MQAAYIHQHDGPETRAQGFPAIFNCLAMSALAKKRTYKILIAVSGLPRKALKSL